MVSIKSNIDVCKEKHDRALSYLLTMGSKALVLMDNHNNDNESSSVVSSAEEYKLKIRRGLQDESLIKAAMMKDEVVRNFRRRLLEQDGIQVVKRSRNGRIRKIDVRLKIKKTSYDCLVWRSLIWGKKKFYLKELKSIVLLNESQRFIRLENSSRFIDVKFITSEEEQGFLHCMQSYIDKLSLLS
jgi:hypothetical protein